MSMFNVFSSKNKTESVDHVDSDIDLDLDFDDDFDFDDPFAEDDRKPVEKVVSGIGTGFSSKFKDPNFLKDKTLRALPYEYGVLDTQLSSSYSTLKGAMDQAMSDIRPGLRETNKLLNRIVPQNEGLIRSLYDKTLGKFLTDDDNETQSPEERNEEIIEGKLDQIFARQDEKNLAEKTIEESKDQLDREVEQKRFNISTDLALEQSNNIGRLVSYQDNITKAYQRESLKLQYRQLFSQNELLINFKEYMRMFKATGDSITKNTSLPEITKITNSEKFEDTLKTKFSESIYGGLFGGRKNLLTSLTDTLRNKIQDTAGQVKSGLESVAMASSMGDMGISGMELAGEMGGSLVADWTGNWLSGKLESMLDQRPDLREKLIDKGLALMNLNEAGIGAYSRDLFRENYEGNGITEKAKSVLRWLSDETSTGILSDEMDTNMSIRQLAQPVPFDGRTRESINTIIPGYLARMLRELTSLRSGKESDMVLFDHRLGRFRDKGRISSDLVARFTRDQRDSDAARRTESFARDVLGDKGVDSEIGGELRRFMLDLSTKDMRYTREEVTKTDLYRNLSNEAKQKLDAYFETMDGGTPGTRVKERRFEQNILRTRRNLQDPRSEIEEMLRMGLGDALIDTGLLTDLGKDGKDSRYRFNREEYLEQFRRALDGTTGESKEDDSSKSSGNRFTNFFKKKAGQPSKIVNEYTVDTSAITTLQKESMAESRRNTTEIIEAILSYRNSPIAVDLSVIDRGLKKLTESFEINIGRIGSGTSSRDRGSNRDRILDNFFDLIDIKNRLSKVKGKASKEIKDLLRELNRSDLATDVQVELLRAYEESKITYDEIRTILAESSLRTGKRTLGARTLEGGRYLKDRASDLGGRALAVGDKAIKSILPVIDSIPGAVQNTAEKVGPMLGKGLESLGKVSLEGLALGKDILFNKLPEMITGVTGRIKSIASNIHSHLVIEDIYAKGDQEPRLTARLLRRGFYRLLENGKPVRHVGDISGPVTDADGNVVLTTEEIERGLVNKDGETLRSPTERVIGSIRNMFSGAIDRSKLALEVLGNIIGKPFEFLLDTMGLGTGNRSRFSNIDENIGIIKDIMVSWNGGDPRGGGSDYPSDDGPGDGPGLADPNFIGPLLPGDGGGSHSSVRTKGSGSIGAAYGKVKDYVAGGSMKKDVEKAGQFLKDTGATERLSAAKDKLAGTKAGGMFSKLKDSKAGAVVGGMVSSGIETGGKLVNSLSKGRERTEEKKDSGPDDGGIIGKLMQRIRDLEVSKKVAEAGQGMGEGTKAFKDKTLERLALADSNRRDRVDASTLDGGTKEASKYDVTNSILGEGFDMLKEWVPKIADWIQGIFLMLGGGKLLGWGGKLLDKVMPGRFRKKAPGMGGGFAGGAENRTSRKGRGGSGGRKTTTTPRSDRPTAARTSARPTVRKPMPRRLMGGLKGGLYGMGGMMAADALGAPEWVGDGIAIAGTAATVASLSGVSLAGIGSAIGTGLAGLGAVVSAPVLVGAAVVGGVAAAGYGIYKFVKYLKNKPTEIDKIRFAEYGLIPGSKGYNDRSGKLFALEAYMRSLNPRITKDGKFEIDDKFDLENVLKFLEIDAKDPKAVQGFVFWFNNRFKPVFAEHFRAMKEAGALKDSTSQLSSIGKVDQLVRLRYLENLKSSEGAYGGIDLFGTGSAENSSAVVEGLKTTQMKELRKWAKDNGKDVTKDTASGSEMTGEGSRVIEKLGTDPNTNLKETMGEVVTAVGRTKGDFTDVAVEPMPSVSVGAKGLNMPIDDSESKALETRRSTTKTLESLMEFNRTNRTSEARINQEEERKRLQMEAMDNLHKSKMEELTSDSKTIQAEMKEQLVGMNVVLETLDVRIANALAGLIDNGGDQGGPRKPDTVSPRPNLKKFDRTEINPPVGMRRGFAPT